MKRSERVILVGEALERLLELAALLADYGCVVTVANSAAALNQYLALSPLSAIILVEVSDTTIGKDVAGILGPYLATHSIPLLQFDSTANESAPLLAQAPCIRLPHPLSAEALEAILGRWVSRTREAATAGQDQESNLRQRLGEIPGLELTVGVDMVRGDLGKYVQMLRLFAATYQGKLERLSSSVVRGNLSGMESIANALRGSAGMVGAQRVATLADDLMRAVHRPLAARGDIDRLGERLTVELGALLAHIREVIDGVEIETSALLTIVTPTDFLQNLQDCLDQGDFRANRLACAESAQLQRILGPIAPALIADIKAFAYTRAAAVLRDFLSRSTAI